MQTKSAFFAAGLGIFFFLFLFNSPALAEKYPAIEITGPSEENPTIEISGPSSVGVGESVQLDATTTGFGDEDYMWYLSFWEGDEMPFQVGSSGEVTGLTIGKGQITVTGLASQASTTYDFYTDSGKDVTLFLDIHAVHVNGNTLEVEVDCEVKGQPAEGTELLAGVMFEDTLYFLPDFTTEVQAFSLNPKVGIHELIQFPLHQVPYNLTFYAATVDGLHGELTSNLASEVFMGKEINE